MRKLQEIESILNIALKEFMDRSSIAGISVGIVLDGQPAYTKGFGVKSIDSEEMVHDGSMFHSASISKTFVATALMQLWERELIDLDKFLIDYIPYFKLKDERYKKITIRQMLSHISGMPDVYDYEWETPQYGDDALEKYVRGIYDYELLWEPGEQYSYSNLAYEILGHVISKVSGMTFEAYVKENILEPLGMKESSFLIREISQEILTSPHVISIEKGCKPKVNEFYPYNRIHGPSSTLWSNPMEMCNYAIANLKRGKYKDFQLLKPETYDIMWKPCAETGNDSVQVGISWFMREYKGVKLIFHTGGDTGYRSNLVLIPEKAAALVLYCNSEYVNLLMLTDYVLDVMLGDELEPLKISAAQEIVSIVCDKGIEAATARFDEIRNMCKPEYYINEAQFNMYAYQLKVAGKLVEAMAVLKLAITELPKASNLYDTMGEFYLEAGDRDNAIIHYRKSLELKPNSASSINALRSMGLEA